MTRTFTKPIHNGHTRTATVKYAKDGSVISIYENNTCPKSGGCGWLYRKSWGNWNDAEIAAYLTSMQ